MCIRDSRKEDEILPKMRYNKSRQVKINEK